MKLNPNKVQVGALVVFNDLPDATVFEVTQRDGMAIMVREHGTNYAAHRSDVSLCHRPPIPAEPKTIDITPTWGEVGLIYHRLAASGERKAMVAARPEFARAFAAASALNALNPTLTDEQKALMAKTITEELTKWGY